MPLSVNISGRMQIVLHGFLDNSLMVLQNKIKSNKDKPCRLFLVKIIVWGLLYFDLFHFMKPNPNKKIRLTVITMHH